MGMVLLALALLVLLALALLVLLALAFHPNVDILAVLDETRQSEQAVCGGVSSARDNIACFG